MPEDVSGRSPGSGAPRREPLAVLAADLVGYTRLMDQAEWDTYARVRALRTGLVDPLVVSFRGRVVKGTGDGFLATFASPADALACAVAIQSQVRLQEAGRGERGLRLRIGLNWGETIADTDDVYGGAVNIAARLEQVAPPGGILVSRALRERIGGPLPVALRDLGTMELRNLERPVHALAVELPGLEAGPVASHAAAVRRARLPSIAVLPFRTPGRRRGEAWFGAGMVEDITRVLTGLRDLVVIAHGSALAVGGDRAEPARAGRELGVRYVLDGSVRRSRDRVRLSVRLSDCEAAALLWSDRFEVAPGELFTVQDRIVERIAWTVAPHLRGAELRRLERQHPESLDAYELVLQAIDLLYRMRRADFARARPLLDRAIELDDGYASAYAHAAKWHLFNVGQGWSDDPERDAAEAGRLAAAAVQRDPADALALAIRGHVEAFLFHRYEAAERLLERALAVGPGHALAWSLASGNAAYVGDAATAIGRAEWGLRLSPIDLRAFFYLSFLGIAHYAAGNFAEALVWAGRTRALNPAFHANLRVLAATLVALGRLEEAREVGAALLAEQPAFRLDAYAPRCPWRDPPTRTLFLERLEAAGLPR